MIRDQLLQAGLLFEKPDHSCAAQTYWHNFFAAETSPRAPRIVYYDGDPTEALRQWRGYENANNILDTENLVDDENYDFLSSVNQTL